jgi:uncharacterized protein DUF4157
MTGETARDRAVRERQSESASKAEQPAEVRGTVRRAVLELQRSAGNMAVERLAGTPLDESLRAEMEERLGADLSHVRIHADARAAVQAQEEHAVALTRGADVTFARGMFQPSSQLGRVVLAHELAHVVQQTRRAGHPPLQSEGLEAEADIAAAGAGPIVGAANTGTVQRLSDFSEDPVGFLEDILGFSWDEQKEKPLDKAELRWAEETLLPSLAGPKSWKEHLGSERAARVMRLHSGVAHRFADDTEFEEWKLSGGKPRQTTAAPTKAPSAGQGESASIRYPNVQTTFDEATSRWIVSVDGVARVAIEVPDKTATVPFNVTTDDRGNVAVEADETKGAKLVPLAGKTQEEIFKENWQTRTTKEQKLQAAQLSTRLEREGLPIYYTKEMRELDAPPDVLKAIDFFSPVPVGTVGWQLVELVAGETLSGVPVDRGHRAKEIVKDVAEAVVFGEISGRVVHHAGGVIIPEEGIVRSAVPKSTRSGSTTAREVPPVPREPRVESPAPASSIEFPLEIAPEAPTPKSNAGRPVPVRTVEVPASEVPARTTSSSTPAELPSQSGSSPAEALKPATVPVTEPQAPVVSPAATPAAAIRPGRSPSNPPSPPTATSEVVGKPEPMPTPDAPVAKVAPKTPVKPTVDVKPPAAPTPDTRQLTLEIEQAQQRYDRLRKKASRAEADYAKRLRNTTKAKERRGEQPTQQETDLLATSRALKKTRDEALAKLRQTKKKLRALQPSQGAAKHGEAGLAQEPIYVDELQARGLQAQLTGKNTPVIDAAIVGTPEVHSVKSIVPSAGSEVAVRLAENGSPRDLADRVSKRITEALVDRRSDKWSRLRNRWNNTMRATHADQFGYELPENPDDISLVVEVRVLTAKAPSATAQQEVEAAVTAWLKKNERVPPRFTWRITYVGTQ